MSEIDSFISNKFSIYIESFEMALKSYLGEILSFKMLSTSIYCNDYSQFVNFKKQFPDKATLKSDSQSDINRKYSFRVYDMLPLNQMYSSNMTVIAAPANIISNRIRAINKILESNRNSGTSSNISIQHCYDKGEIPPIWIVIHTLSLGDLLALFNMLKKNDRVEFCKYILRKKRVKSVDIAGVSTKVNEIRKIRNTINHYEPIIPYLMKYVDDGKKDTIISVVNVIKKHNKCSNIKYPVIKRSKIWELTTTAYNRKYIVFIDELIYKML